MKRGILGDLIYSFSHLKNLGAGNYVTLSFSEKTSRPEYTGTYRWVAYIVINVIKFTERENNEVQSLKTAHMSFSFFFWVLYVLSLRILNIPVSIRCKKSASPKKTGKDFEKCFKTCQKRHCLAFKKYFLFAFWESLTIVASNINRQTQRDTSVISKILRDTIWLKSVSLVECVSLAREETGKSVF